MCVCKLHICLLCLSRKDESSKCVDRQCGETDEKMKSLWFLMILFMVFVLSYMKGVTITHAQLSNIYIWLGAHIYLQFSSFDSAISHKF